MSGSAIDKGIEAANRIAADGVAPLSAEEGRRKAQDLLSLSEIAMVGSNGGDGHPHIKAMFKIRADGLRHVYFSTNTSSRRVSQFRQDPKSCLYFFDPDVFCGLMLSGTMEIADDPELKQRLWREGWKAYYPQGVTDPDYTILQFTASWGNVYQGLRNVSFPIT